MRFCVSACSWPYAVSQSCWAKASKYFTTTSRAPVPAGGAGASPPQADNILQRMKINEMRANIVGRRFSLTTHDSRIAAVLDKDDAVGKHQRHGIVPSKCGGVAVEEQVVRQAAVT